VASSRFGSFDDNPVFFILGHCGEKVEWLIHFGHHTIELDFVRWSPNKMSVLILRDRFSTVDTIPIRLDISLQTAHGILRVRL